MICSQEVAAFAQKLTVVSRTISGSLRASVQDGGADGRSYPLICDLFRSLITGQ